MAGFNNLPPTNDPADIAPAPGDLDPGVLEPQARWSLYLAAILASEALESSATSVYDFSQDRHTAGAVPVPENARGLLAAVATVARRRLAIASPELPPIGIEAGLRDEELALTAASARFDFVARPRKNRAANTPLDAVAVTVRYVEGSETQGYGLTLDILIFSAHHPERVTVVQAGIDFGDDPDEMFSAGIGADMAAAPANNAVTLSQIMSQRGVEEVAFDFGQRPDLDVVADKYKPPSPISVFVDAAVLPVGDARMQAVLAQAQEPFYIELTDQDRARQQNGAEATIDPRDVERAARVVAKG